MQLHLTLSSPEFTLPASYRRLIHGMIYHALAQDPDFSARLHERGYAVANRTFKHFTFSQLQGRYRVEGRQIRFAKKASLEIRSVDDRVVELLARSFFAGRQIRLGPCEAEITGAAVTDHHLLQESARIRMRSPAVAHITLPDGHTRFFSPEDEAFFSALARNAQRKWISLRGAQEECSLRVSPVAGAPYKKQVSMFKDTCITGWLGEYVLEGNPQALDMLYHTGLGEKNPQGFGLFDPVDPSRLTTPVGCAMLSV